jgi:predicted esterase
MASVALPLKHVLLAAQRSPSDGRKPPLLVLLHGTGASEHDLLDCGREIQAALGGELAVASVRAPLRAEWGGFAWFQGFSSAPEPRALERTVRGARVGGAQCHAGSNP